MVPIDKYSIFSCAWKIEEINTEKELKITEIVMPYIASWIKREYDNILTVIIAIINVITASTILNRAILTKYLFPNDLSLETSLIVNVLRPKSAKIIKIPVKAIDKERIPKFSTPRYRAEYIVVKNMNM